MGVSDFLFEGRPPPSVTTYGQTVESMPKWLSDYTQGLVARANAVASEPYQPYGGPRIAGFSPQEEQAFDMTQQNVGSYKPYLEAASGQLQGGLSQAGGMLDAGTQSFTDSAVQDYMDPYVQNVLDRNTSLAKRAYTEEFLPELQGAFTRAGHFGSDRMMDLANRGTRDVMENLSEQNRGALSQAYSQAADIYGADRGREIQGAGIAGELGLRGSEQLGALGEAAQRMGLTDAGALEAVGRTQRGMNQSSLDLAYQDFERQRDYPRETIDWMSSVIRGMPYDRAQQTTGSGPADAYQPSGASQLASLLTAGAGAYDIFKNSARGGLAQYAKGGKVKQVAKAMEQHAGRKPSYDYVYDHKTDTVEVRDKKTGQLVKRVKKKRVGGLAQGGH